MFSIASGNVAITSDRVNVMFSIFHDDRLFQSVTPVTLASPVVDLSLQGAVLNGSMAFVLTPQSYNATASYTCVFWNTGTLQWDTTGVTTMRVNGSVLCMSVHLTSFAVLVVGMSSCFSLLTHTHTKKTNITFVELQLC